MGGDLESRCIGRVYGADCALYHSLVLLRMGESFARNMLS